MTNPKKGMLAAGVAVLLAALALWAAVAGMRGGRGAAEVPAADTGDKHGPTEVSADLPDVVGGYVPLADINGDAIIERAATDRQVANNGALFEKTDGYRAVMNKPGVSFLLTDEADRYIAVGETRSGGGQTDMCIAICDPDGNEIERAVYGGSDFEMVHAAKYHPDMGIVITGIIQSKDGDFAAYTAREDSTPFVVCIDAETMKIRWVSPVQTADSVYCVTGDGVFIVRNEGAPYDGMGSLMLSVVKLDRNGEKVWQTEPLDQWICSIAELRDGGIVVVQRFADSRSVNGTGAISLYGADGVRRSTFEADCYGELTATDDGGVIMTALRNVRPVPQPVYVSSMWFDTETVVVKYDKDGNIEWRKTYDRVQGETGVDTVIPNRDGSVTILHF